MKRINFLALVLIFCMATFSQTGGRRAQGAAAVSGGPREPFEIKQSVFFSNEKLELNGLDEYLTSEWDSNFVHINKQERYSASGAKLEWMEYQYNVDKGYITTKLTRDVEERLKNRVVYQYQKDRLWRENLVDNKGKTVSIFEFEYDNRGNQTRRVIKNRAGATLAETVYTYNDRRQMTVSETKDASGARVISSTRYFYDAGGNLTKQEVYDGDGNITSVITSIFQNGNEVRNEIANADGRVQLRIFNEWGENGELLKKTVQNIQGESNQVIHYEYTFRPARR